MLFNSYHYLFMFFPVAVAVYFILNARGLVLAAKIWLVIASLFFYSVWNPQYLILIVTSIIFNFLVGTGLSKFYDTKTQSQRKLLLTFGVVFNIGFLAYFKYADFFIANINAAFGLHNSPLHLILPLAISFFTFQQTAYLVDSYRGETKGYDFLNYSLFVTFFPHLIAGPILHHAEMMPQFRKLRPKLINWNNVSLGLFIFFIGLFKKTVIADTFAIWANHGYDNNAAMTLLNAWIVTLSYTLQLYFDFSGYTDMAIGSAYVFNIKLPQNFNSPYKAINIQDFWRRWHITLSRWLRVYLYIPLGGNKKSEARTYANLIITFVLGGLWHGAAWTFVAWGAMHGFGTAIHKWWHTTGIKMPRFIAWLLTFLFVHIAWVFFRAKTFDKAVYVLKGLIGLNGITVSNGWEIYASISETATMLTLFLGIAFFAKNSGELAQKFRPSIRYALITAVIAVYGILGMGRISEFIYFNF